MVEDVLDSHAETALPHRPQIPRLPLDKDALAASAEVAEDEAVKTPPTWMILAAMMTNGDATPRHVRSLREQPARPLTPEDERRIEAARQKRRRKAIRRKA